MFSKIISKSFGTPLQCLEHSGEFNMHFDYTNWFDTEYSFSDQMIIWKHKYLGEVPIDENDKALIHKYDNEFPNNPI